MNNKMHENLIFKWDNNSDQPFPIKDKKYKRDIRKKNILEYISLLITNIIVFPIGMLLMHFFRSYQRIDNKFYSMGIDLNKGEIQKELIHELGVKSVLVRFPLWEMDRIDEYERFIKSYRDDEIEVIINILQDREHIENERLLKTSINIIFKTFSPYVNEYQIGNAINRTKWGFFSMAEYMIWYKIIQNIRDERYSSLNLIGSSVIDFEFHYTIRTLFNFLDIKFDTLSSLLYVDRRGAPQNKQMLIFDTKNKINMLYSLACLSPKVSADIYITEVNWPLSNTSPYAPTSEKECVSEEVYSSYMVDYFKIAKETNKIQRVYWHQLIAPGYGLVDNRNGKIRKTKAFYAFKEMIENENEKNIY
jgi:hypothetical protein